MKTRAYSAAVSSSLVRMVGPRDAADHFATKAKNAGGRDAAGSAERDAGDTFKPNVKTTSVVAVSVTVREQFAGWKSGQTPTRRAIERGLARAGFTRPMRQELITALERELTTDSHSKRSAQ